MDKIHLLRKPKVFYGYWIVLVTFLCLFIFAGGGVYAFSLFVKPLEAHFGWGRGEIMIGFTLLFLIRGVTSPFVGKLVDRYGARKVISTGALTTGLGFLLLTQVSSLWHFYLGCSIIGVGIAALGPIPTSAVVSQWFQKKRGLAIGLMSPGFGVGGFVVAPLVGSYLIPSFGWRAAYLALAILTWVLIIPLALLVIKAKPADMGLYPDGVKAPEMVTVTQVSPSDSGGLTLKMALTTLPFWLISIRFSLGAFSQVGTLQSQVPYLQDIGFPMVTAATALGTVGLMSALGKFGFGWLCDRISPKYAGAIGLGLQAMGIIALMNVGPTSPPAMIWLYAIMLGLGIGSWLPTMSMLTSTTFGLASYGTIFGMVNLTESIGAATGPLVAGYMYDITNTYHWAFTLFAALYAIAIPAILILRRRKSI